MHQKGSNIRPGSSIAWSMILCIAILLGFVGCAEKSQDGPWTDLIRNDSLEGWSQKGGTGKYHMEGSTIVGTTVNDHQNTFLVTDETFDDFILELEFVVHPGMNSGIQIRSNSDKDYRDGVVHGYQVEIDPSERSWTGGIYDESRRGWLYPIEDTQVQAAFKQEEWNHFRIEAMGDTIKTWLNGVPAAHLVDDMTGAGFIGLQVHGIGDFAEVGQETKWRNIRILTEELENHAQTSALEPVYGKK